VATWKKPALMCAVMLAIILIVSPQSQAQQSNSSYLRAAAQQYSEAAAKCTNPAGAQCLREYAAYENCMANGGNCGSAPACSTACPAGGSSAGTSLPMMMPSSLPGTNAEAQQAGELMALGILGLSHLLSHHSQTQPEPQVDPAAAAAAQAAALQQQQEAEAASILGESDQLLASLNTAPQPPAQPDASAVVDSLLDSTPPANNATSTVESLLGDSGSTATPAGDTAETGNSDSTSTVADLLGDSSAPAAAPGVGVASPATAAIALPAALLPQDSQVASAMEESVDQPAAGEEATLGGMLESEQPATNDGLNELVPSGNTLASDLTDDPVAGQVVSAEENFTPVPLPEAGDTPEQATDKVYAQSVAGFGNLLAGLADGPTGFAKGLYSYGTKMVNQMGADLGLANATIFETGPGFSN
jgi:hypothetical protein